MARHAELARAGTQIAAARVRVREFVFIVTLLSGGDPSNELGEEASEVVVVGIAGRDLAA